MMYIPDSDTAAIASSLKLPHYIGNLYETVADAICGACREGHRRATVSIKSEYLDYVREVREVLVDLGYYTVVRTGGRHIATAADMMTAEHLYDFVHLDISW